MKKSALIIVCILVFTLLVSGCLKNGHTITIGPTDVDPNAKAPTITGEESTPAKTTRTEPALSENPDEIMQRLNSLVSGEFDCDVEVKKVEKTLAEAREVNTKIEEEFFDVLRELDAAQKGVEHEDTPVTQARYSRAQKDYDDTNSRAKESRENIKTLKLAINFAKERCESPVRDIVTPKVAPIPPPAIKDVCGDMDNIASDLKDEIQDLFDKEQDRLDELFERYNLEDDLDEADAKGEDIDDIASDIDDKNEVINELDDDVNEHRSDVEDLRHSMNQHKDKCTLPHEVIRVCTKDRKDIEETISNLGDDISELEDEIDNARADRITAIEEDDAGGQDNAEEELSSKRDTIREKMDKLFEQKDDLFAHRVVC